MNYERGVPRFINEVLPLPARKDSRSIMMRTVFGKVEDKGPAIKRRGPCCRCLP